MIQTNYVLMIMYDVPMNTRQEQQRYRHLVNYLQRSGFYLLQGSIYLKPLSEKHKAERYCNEIKSRVSESSHVRAIILTHQSFLSMKQLVGKKTFGEQLICQPNSVLTL